MTPERILLKLTKRSTPATAAYDTWLAQGYSLADLTADLIKMAITEHTDSLEQPSALKSVDSIATGET